MSDTCSSSSGCIGMFGLLGVLFIGLKLTGYIDWGWIWILSPFWIPIVLVIVILIIIGLVMLILWVLGELFG